MTRTCEATRKMPVAVGGHQKPLILENNLRFPAHTQCGFPFQVLILQHIQQKFVRKGQKKFT